jgi:DNA glycosylase AlkZ-like
MTNLDIARQRLHNQALIETAFSKPRQVVRWLGAVQAQDYAAAKWALALRLQDATDDDIERAFTEGAILRTHVMRPTWHFVAPEDIRWLLALTAPRVHAANSYQYRRLELDKSTIKRSNAAIARALRGGQQLTRTELASVLQKAGIDARNLRLGYLIIRAELDGVICSGARRGKQFTYALLDQRAPASKILDRDEALAELTRRYLTSHGPSTEEDFRWWSGLARADVRSGIELIKRQLASSVIDGTIYWSVPSAPLAKNRSQSVHLLPNFDEYIVGYTDRSAIFDSFHTDKLDARANPLFQHTIVINGQIKGTWKRVFKKNQVAVELHPFAPLTKDERNAVVAAAQKYAKFLGLPVALPRSRG